MKKYVMLAMMVLLFSIFPISAFGSVSQPQQVSQVNITLASPYSAHLNVSYIEQVDSYSKRVVYTSFEEKYASSYSSVVLQSPILPVNITVKGLFGAAVSAFNVSEGGSRFGFATHYGSSFSYLLVKNVSIYDGSALHITVHTEGSYVGINKTLNVSFWPAPFPSESLDLRDTYGAEPSAISSSDILSIPYGDVVSYSVSYPSDGSGGAVTSTFDYQATGNAAGSTSMNMTENSSLVVKPVFTGQYAFVSFVFYHYSITVGFKKNVTYGRGDWVNGSFPVDSNRTVNLTVEGAHGATKPVYPTMSLISIFLPPAGAGSKVVYNVTDFRNGTTWHRSSGYFNLTVNGSFGYMVVPYVQLIRSPNSSGPAMLHYIIEAAAGIVGVFSIVILAMMAVGFMAGGSEAVADTYDKLKGLVVMDALFFIVFVAGLVFQILGGI